MEASATSPVTRSLRNICWPEGGFPVDQVGRARLEDHVVAVRVEGGHDAVGVRLASPETSLEQRTISPEARSLRYTWFMPLAGWPAMRLVARGGKGDVPAVVTDGRSLWDGIRVCLLPVGRRGAEHHLAGDQVLAEDVVPARGGGVPGDEVGGIGTEDHVGPVRADGREVARAVARRAVGRGGTEQHLAGGDVLAVDVVPGDPGHQVGGRGVEGDVPPAAAYRVVTAEAAGFPAGGDRRRPATTSPASARASCGAITSMVSASAAHSATASQSSSSSRRLLAASGLDRNLNLMACSRSRRGRRSSPL